MWRISRQCIRSLLLRVLGRVELNRGGEYWGSESFEGLQISEICISSETWNSSQSI